jgi:hypothetical protein
MASNVAVAQDPAGNLKPAKDVARWGTKPFLAQLGQEQIGRSSIGNPGRIRGSHG